MFLNYSQAQHRNNIKEFQEYLYAISFYNDTILRVIPDGIYGRETVLAVKSFQKEYDLPITGEVDRATWEKAVEVYRYYVDSPAEAIAVFPYNSFKLQKGEKGSMVFMLQSMLHDISKTYPNVPMPTINGIYDGDTFASVKSMQVKARLNPTGITNKLTWNIIVKTYLHLDASLKY
jgi:peptidoglycan hydrolase-like protein with peptidoglycan-binding domain